MPDERTRAEMLAEAERLEAEAQALLNGDYDPAEFDDFEDDNYPSNDLPMEPGKRSYPPPPPPSDNRTIHLANKPARRCTAHRKNGEQCRKWAIYGGTVCASHGGRAPNVVAKAKRRLEEAADRMAKELLDLAESNGSIPPYVKLQAIDSALNRAGVVEPKQVEVAVSTPFDQLLGEVAGGSRADYRRSVGHPDPEPFSLPIGHADTHRPGGPRVLGETFDGHLVLDGELGDDREHQAVRDPGESDRSGPSDDQPDYYEPGRQTLTNPVPLPNLPNGGYLPTEDALEVAQNANRNHRAKMRRR